MKSQIQDFIDYVMSFYAHGKIYDMSFHRAEVVKATKIRQLFTNQLPFDGDTVDRELVRDIVMAMRG